MKNMIIENIGKINKLVDLLYKNTIIEIKLKKKNLECFDENENI